MIPEIDSVEDGYLLSGGRYGFQVARTGESGIRYWSAMYTYKRTITPCAYCWNLAGEFSPNGYPVCYQCIDDMHAWLWWTQKSWQSS